MALYTVLQTVAINNRNVVLYLVEGEEIELPEEEAAHIIPLGYIEAPAPPEARKGKVQKPETPEDKLEKRETRVIEDDDDPVMTTESFKGKK